TDNMTAISCSESSGSVTGACSANYASGAQVTLTANASGGSTFVSWGGACASTGNYPICFITMSQAQNVSANFASQADFGTANLCPGGIGSAPCSTTMMVTINFPSNGEGYVEPLGVQVLTDGQFGISTDFQLQPGGDHCSYEIVPAPGSCFVYVTFTPQAPGLRMGAVVVTSNTPQAVTQLISGIGQGAEAAFGPSITGNYPAVTSSSQVNPVANLTGYSGVTTDAFGNLYHLTGPSLVELAPPYNGTPATVATGFSTAYSVAIDGAGNLYVADPSLNTYGEVVKLAPGCTSATAACASVIYAPSSHPGPIGVAVDALGNVFVAQNLTGVFEIPVNGGPNVTLYNPPGNSLGGMAVDTAGDLFVADSGLHQVVEIPAGCTTTSCQTLIGSGWASPQDVAVDAAGDIIVGDVALTIGTQIDAGGVVEVPAGCTTPSCQILLWTSGGAPDPSEVAVTSTGQVFFVTDGTPVYEIDQSQPPSVVFGSTSIGLELGPDPVTIQNIGTQALNGSVASVQTTNFAEVTSTCNSSFSLNPGTLCTENFEFEPQSTGAFSDSAQESDNSLNGAPATQTINLSGTGTGGGSAVTVSVTGTGTGNVSSSLINCAIVGGVAQAGCSETALTGNTYTFYESPIVGTVFTGWGGACSSFAPNQNCTIGITGPTNIIANFISGYTLTVTDLGTGAGSVTSNSLASPAISCAISGGSVTGTCSESDSSGASVTLTAKATGGSTFTGWGGACSNFGTSTQCTVTMNAAESVSASFAQGSFGGVNVCTGGSPSGCTGTSQTVTFNFTASTTVNSVQVVTQGATGLDFQEASDTCSGNTFSSGLSCTVTVNFTPTAPGLRLGAASLLDGSGNVLLTQLVSGIGQGPAAALSPGNQTTVTAVDMNYPVGVALDGAGDLYIANYGSSNRAGYVLKVTPGGVQTTVLSAYTSAPGQAPAPVGVAVDGAGDLFIVDLYLPYAVELTPSGVQTTVGSGLNYPIGIALDGAGDVFIGDQNNKRVVEVTSGGVQTTVPFTGLQQPWGVAVDTAGDVFVGDGGNQSLSIPPSVQKITPGGVQTVVPTTGLGQPYDISVDAAGDVYIADAPNGRVLEVTPSGVQTLANPVILNYPSGLTVNAEGDLFIGDQGVQTVYEVNSSTPLVSFDTGEDYQSQDTPLTVQNVGNQPLTGTVGPVSGEYIYEDLANSSCNSFTLAPAASCVNNYYSDPTTLGLYSGTAQATDNSLNGSPATQTISFTGLSYGLPVTFSVTGTGSGSVSSDPQGINCVITNGTAGASGCSASLTSGYTYSFIEAAAGGYTFAGWGGACSSYGSNQICNVEITPANNNIVANFTANVANNTLTVTDVGNGSGTVTSGDGLISCSEANGAGSGTCSGNYSSGALVTLTAASAANSAFLGWSGACASAGTSPTCSVTMNQSANAIADFVQQNFGNVNVCPSGVSTPAPCSATLPVTFNLAATTTVGAIQVVTQGATGLDFSLGSGSTCTGTIAQSNTCNVNVNFAPRAPGLRAGAVELYDTGGNLVATTPIYGIGQAPAAAFSPAAQTTVYSGNSSFVSNSVAVDAAGDLFIAQTEGIATDVGQVVKVAANGTQTTVGTGLEYPQGLAVDGAGNVYVADNNLGEVVKIPAGCTNSACQTTVGSGLSSQLGVAVDGAGDVFIGSYGQSEVVKVPANGGPQTVVYNPVTGSGPASHPIGLAVDAAGDLFIADGGLQQVVEVPAGCTTSGCQVSIGSNWQLPQSVAVDAAGDVFVSDTTLEQVVEVPAGCTSSACQASCTPGSCAVVVANGIVSLGATVDTGGDIFIANAHASQVVEVTRLLPPSFNFALTNVGSTSADSPQLVSVQNVGNQLLAGSLVPSLGSNFLESGNCGSGFSLAPGGSCSESFSFTPQTTGYLTGSASFTDNTLNLSPLVALQTVNLVGNGGLNGQPVGVAVPNVVGLLQASASTTITDTGLAMGTVSTASSSVIPSGSVIASNPAAGTMVNPGSAVRLLVSSGAASPPVPNPLTLENNYFVTGDYASAGVTLRGLGKGGVATGTITIADSTTNPGVSQGVPDGADIIDGFLYWETLENTTSPSGGNGTFLGYPITGQQIGSDLDNYTDGTLTGTLRVYRADVNAYFPIGANGVRFASGAFTVSLPDAGGSAFPLTEGASLVVIYRVLSPNFPLKAVVIYDGSALPSASTTQNMQGFYDAVGTGESTTLFAAGGSWSNSSGPVTLGAHASQFSAPIDSGNAYAAVILSTLVNNSDNDGILDVWKTGPTTGDFYAGQPGYYDAKTGSWVSLPGAKHGEKDLFVQLDYMCGAVLSNGACDPSQENLFPAPDSSGNDPLAIVKQSFASAGVTLHLEIGNAVPESTCMDNTSTTPTQLCQFPGEPGVIGWKNSLEFSKLWPRNLASCAAGGDCSPRFPYGQKDSYHYVLFGHSLAVPAWNTRYATLTSIQVVNGVTTVGTIDRGNLQPYECPTRITISGVLGDPSLNGVYNTSSCPDSQTMIMATPGVPNWSYPNSTMPEPEIGLTPGTVTSISGYSDLGGADSAVSLALWETVPNQDMSKRANVIAGTLFHEIGHTLGLSHGGLYYNTPGSYVPTFDVNCKPNYQSSMNYLFQLDGVGPSAAVAYSNQSLETLNEVSLASVVNLTDGSLNPATFSTSAWYTSTAPSTTASAAIMHCDGTPLTGDTGYRVDGPIAPVTPAWSNGQNLGFDGVSYTQMLGYNDVANLDLRQVGATGGELASLASVLSFGSSQAPLNISAGGNVEVGSGGTVSLGNGGNITLGSGGTATLSNSGTITLGSGGIVTLGSGGNVTLSSAGTISPGSSGIVTLGSGGIVTLGSGGIVT
ncbi:MAG: PASTA domain-containing protein, partial [Terracidiphilus sp.]